MFLQAHGQRVDPAVEQHIGAFPTHLRAVARGEVLHMDGGRNHRTGNAQPLGDVALHLAAEHQFGGGGDDGVFDLHMVVGDQRLDTVFGGGLAQVAREFAVVAAKSDDFEAELLMRNTGRGNGMRRIAENEDALAGQIVRVDRARPPRHPRLGSGNSGLGIGARKCSHFADEFGRGAMADGDSAHERLAEGPLQPARRRVADFRI